MRVFVILAERRSDWAAAPVAISKDEAQARQALADAATNLCQRGSPIVRCRLRPVNLAPAQVYGILRRFGQEDADAGLTLDEARQEAASRFCPTWASEYLAGFQHARQGL